MARNCGHPYRISGVIEKGSSLLVGTEQMFRAMLNMDAHTSCEAIAMDRKMKTVDLWDVKTGMVTTETYDKLVMSPGAASVQPSMPGIDLPGIFPVRTVPDASQIREWFQKRIPFLAEIIYYSGMQLPWPTARALVVGGACIGL